MIRYNTFYTFILLLLGIEAFAQVTLDQSFGNQGIVATPNTFAIQKSVLSSDDKIICIGNFKTTPGNYKTLIAKYNNDGSLDNEFGENGLVYDTDTVSKSSYLFAIDTLPNGEIFVGGYHYYDHVNIGGVYYSVDSAFIAKYDRYGSLDNTFGQGGVKKYSFGSMSANINSIVYTDNSILAGFNGDNGSSGVVMLKTDGTIDQSWANNGFIHFDLELILYGIMRDSNGLLYCFGSNFQGFNSFGESYGDIVVMRFLPNGNPDETFGDNGVFALEQAAHTQNQEYSNKLEVLADGSCIIGGINYNGSKVLLKVNAQGKLDSSFAENGVLYHNQAYSDFVITESEQILIGGSSVVSSFNYGYSVALVSENGAFDTNFNNGVGSLSIDISSGNDYLTSMVLQSDDKVILSGSAELIDGEATFALLRLKHVFTSISELGNVKERLKVYPNPSSGICHLEIDKSIQRVDGIVVKDLSGKIVHKSPLLGSQRIDLSHLNNGVYLLEIQTNDGIEVITLMKQ